jgi:type II secretory pathway pseudopilin PulG
VKKLAAQSREPVRLRTAACSRRQENRCQEGRPREKGYVLLTLLLAVALMAILAMGVIIPIKFQNQRDQEQEMIHRGVQYTRAIRAYYRKFQRYPTKLEDLDNSNQMRFLRKHYKDPLNKNGDFKLLHYGEPGVTLGGGFSLGGGSIPGATPAGSPSGLNGSGPGGSGFGGSAFGGSESGGSGFGSSGSGGSGVNSSGIFSQSSGFGGSSNSGFGANANSASGTNGTSANQPTVPDGSQTPSTSGDSGSSGISGNGATDQSSSSQLVVGGAIVGVASVSKKTTIREFNHKKKYNEWQFIYDPTLDRGGLITTPYQPGLTQGAAMQPNLNGQPPGSTGSSFGSSGSSSFGNGSSFGQSSGFGNNANPGGSSPPPQPPANPPQ